MSLPPIRPPKRPTTGKVDRPGSQGYVLHPFEPGDQLVILDEPRAQTQEAAGIEDPYSPYPAGDEPVVRSLMARLGLAAHQIRRALAALTRQGITFTDEETDA